jgi:GAF domain-containing protein
VIDAGRLDKASGGDAASDAVARAKLEASASETLRQAAVFASGVLAIGRNDALRAIVEQAATLLDTPIAAMSIIDRDRQWCPVAIGLPRETPRALAFCAYAILSPDRTFCVPDAAADQRFADNPLVTHDPGIRFYAGAPIVDRDGQPLGAICAIDRQPRRPLLPAEQSALQALAAEAMTEIERSEDRRTYAPDAIEHIVDQMRDAARSDDEPLLLALDRVVQSLEREIELPMPPDWPIYV